MKKTLVCILVLLVSCTVFGQNINLYRNILKRKTTEHNRPIPYPKVREADVIWAKLLWREVNLREKINLPFYFPENPMDGRYSLIDLLLKGIKEESILAFDTDDDEFKVPIDYSEIKRKFVEADTMSDIYSPEVKRLLVKELWFFDKQTSTMQVRIIGLCPVREFKKEGDDRTIYQKKLFWVNYDECRDLLVKNEIFNVANDAKRMSFDDLFIKRQFSSIIKNESNVYNNRSINSYADGIDAMIESDRIKNEIFNWEQDLWQY